MFDRRLLQAATACLFLPLAACARTEPVLPAEADAIQAAVDRADQDAEAVKAPARLPDDHPGS